IQSYLRASRGSSRPSFFGCSLLSQAYESKAFLIELPVALSPLSHTSRVIKYFPELKARFNLCTPLSTSVLTGSVVDLIGNPIPPSSGCLRIIRKAERPV